MPRFRPNRWWTFILTIIAFAVVSSAFISQAGADVFRDRGGDGTVGDVYGGGAPPPTGAGDPDQPVPSSLKRSQRGQVRTEGAILSSRSVGDSRFEGAVWMWRLSAMGRVLRAYWIRL